MRYPNYRPPKNVIQLTYPIDKDTIDYLVKIHKNELVGYRANMVIKYTKTSIKNMTRFACNSTLDNKKIFIANFVHKNIHVYAKIHDVIPMCKRYPDYVSKTKKVIGVYYRVIIEIIKDLPK